ncbi:MAG: hypothetical protein K4H23_05130 [Mollicutes bacterium PWAP]|nr:hypothetical protein [Mollicutes bacterium PWAP]
MQFWQYIVLAGITGLVTILSVFLSIFLKWIWNNPTIKNISFAVGSNNSINLNLNYESLNEYLKVWKTSKLVPRELFDEIKNQNTRLQKYKINRKSKFRLKLGEEFEILRFHVDKNSKIDNSFDIREVLLLERNKKIIIFYFGAGENNIILPRRSRNWRKQSIWKLKNNDKEK